MSAEYEAALEIKAGLGDIQHWLERLHQRTYESQCTASDRRERIATAALQGIISRRGGSVDDAARFAVAYADALINELNKTPE